MRQTAILMRYPNPGIDRVNPPLFFSPTELRSDRYVSTINSRQLIGGDQRYPGIEKAGRFLPGLRIFDACNNAFDGHAQRVLL